MNGLEALQCIPVVVCFILVFIFLMIGLLAFAVFLVIKYEEEKYGRSEESPRGVAPHESLRGVSPTKEP